MRGVMLKMPNSGLESRRWNLSFTKVEQKQTLQSALMANDNSSNNSSPSFNSVAVPEAIMVLTNSAKHLNGKPLEEKDMDSFLLEAHKKIVSSEIKQRNKEKKFLRKSANQDVTFGNAYVSETVVVA